jgi:hypothetical protein
MSRKTALDTPARKTISPARARSLVTRHLMALDAGKRGYAEADTLLDELLAGNLVDPEIKLPDGRTAVIVDQFAVKNKIWKPCGVARYKLDVREKTG